jgi:hypothetical protein
MVMSDVLALPPSFAARRFGGRSALPREARVTIENDELVCEAQGDGPTLRHRLADIAVAEPLSHAPRLLRLAYGGLLQIEESPTLAAALARAGVRQSPVVRWQRAWPASLVALVLLVAASAWLYFDGLPRVADWAARHISPSLEARLGDKTLVALERNMLAPSALAPDRQVELTQRFVVFQKAAGLEPARPMDWLSTHPGARDRAERALEAAEADRQRAASAAAR